MNVKRTVIVILLFALFAVVLSGCNGKKSQPESSQPESSQPESSQPESSQPESSQPKNSQPENPQPESSQPANPQLKKELAQYTEMLQSGKVSELKMAIHYMDPSILTRYPLGADNVKKSSHARVVTVSGTELSKQIDLLKELSADNLKISSSKYLNARFCCEFSNTSGEVLLTFAFGGIGSDVYVNGIFVKENEVFYKLLIPYIPEEDIKQYLIDGLTNIKG